ncbi:MAG: ZinT/AdcA family metal-binding protein, partial [Eubacteriales bacterium]|nr:ZinT/AdcA family metal-binding protein [Eubacteriales bacterium]
DHDHDHEHGDEAHDHDHDHDHAAPERVVLDDVVLEDWEGEWNSMSAYLNDEELQEALEAHAKAEGETVDEIKAEYLEKYKIDYETMVFAGDTITFYDARLNKDGKEIAKSKYSYVESYKVEHGKHDIEWHVFEGEEGAKFKYLMLMPVHGEETLAHFHMRLGDDVEKMLGEDDWFPTFIKPTTTYDQLADVFGPHEH